MRSIVVTAPEACSLQCPFTGRPIVVQMHIGDGSVKFSAPDAFSLREPRSDMKSLMDDASMRNGVYGSVDTDGALVDPYTGDRFTVRELPDGRVFLAGGFNPRAGVDSLGEFLYRATMRNGVPAMEPPATLKVEKPKSPGVHPAGNDAGGPDDSTMEAAERIVSGAVKAGVLNVTTTTVHMSGGKGGKGGKGGREARGNG